MFRGQAGLFNEDQKQFKIRMTIDLFGFNPLYLPILFLESTIILALLKQYMFKNDFRIWFGLFFINLFSYSIIFLNVARFSNSIVCEILFSNYPVINNWQHLFPAQAIGELAVIPFEAICINELINLKSIKENIKCEVPKKNIFWAVLIANSCSIILCLTIYFSLKNN